MAEDNNRTDDGESSLVLSSFSKGARETNEQNISLEDEEIDVVLRSGPASEETDVVLRSAARGKSLVLRSATRGSLSSIITDDLEPDSIFYVPDTLNPGIYN